MDQQLYEQLLRAVDICHSNTSVQSERDAAYTFCEQFQQRMDCVSYAFFLLQNSSYPTHYRHFALNVVESWIRTHWKLCSPDDAVMYRNTLLTIIASHLNANGEPLYLKEKLVKVVADIAKRQFPQRWPEMHEHLLHLCSMGTAQTELVMLIFRSVAEDCVNASFNSSIPPSRRKDILQGLNACFPQLFPHVYSQLELQYRTLLQNPKHQQATSVVIAGLQMMKEFLDWMPVSMSAAPDTNFIAVASLLVEAPQLHTQLRIAAAECLEVYFSRSFGKEHLALLLATTETCFTHVGRLPLFHGHMHDIPDADTLRFHTHVNCVLVSFTTHQLELLMSEWTSSAAVVAAILPLCSTMFDHPSLYITEALIIVWLHVLKHSQSSKMKPTLLQDLVLPYLPALWTTSIAKYFKLHFSPEYRNSNRMASNVHLIVDFEFDDQDAYAAFFGNFRGRLYGLLRMLVTMQPHVALTHLQERLCLVLSQYASGTDHLTPQGTCTEWSTAHLYHEGVMAFMDCVMKSLPDAAMAQPENISICRSIVNVLLQYTTQDPWLLFRHCLALSYMSKVYYMRCCRNRGRMEDNATTKKNGDNGDDEDDKDGDDEHAKADGHAYYPRIFERLFGLIVYTQAGESVDGMMDVTTTNVRRRALASMISICHVSTKHVLPYLPLLCNQVRIL
jgi:exportin-5